MEMEWLGLEVWKGRERKGGNKQIVESKIYMEARSGEK